MTIDQVKVIEIGADAIEAVLQASPFHALAYPPKLMHAVVAALGRHGFIIEDRYEDSEEYPVDMPEDNYLDSVICLPDWTEQQIPDAVGPPKVRPDWEADGGGAP